ncbi:amino acid adenylation domain-containing protein [Bradyrhizobium oligotrophicum]|uniref:amino acid adenylation domain-containing protein n=1 Tax=Bradyrhizobium oligotrophicum TaxID=44255 RepID=UPI003EBB05FA
MDLQDLDLLDELLQQEGLAETAPVRLRPRGATEAPASLQQRRLWFLTRMDPDSAAYNIATALSLTGQLDLSALQRAVELLVQRQQALRTIFHERDGVPWQCVAPPGGIRLACEDWRDRIVGTDELNELVWEASQHRFDLARGPLFRVRLVRLPDTSDGVPAAVLLICVHHIIADGWSIGVLVDELVESYRAFRAGRTPLLAELPIQYVDYAAWQHEQLDQAGLATQLAYWESQLHDLPLVEFPTDFPRPRMRTFAGDLVPFSLPAATTSCLRQLGGDGTTLFMVLTAAFGVLFARHTRQRDIVIGTSIAQRADRQTHRLIGFLVNMLVLRFELKGEDKFGQLLDRVRAVMVDAIDHGDVPYETLVERLQPERDPARNPLFQVALTMLNAPEPRIDIDGLVVEAIANQSAARFDLEVFFHERQSGELDGVVSFNTDLFLRATIEQLARELCTLLDDIAADPERPVAQLRLLSAHEEQMLAGAGRRQHIAVEDCVHQRFTRQVAATPEQIALEWGGVPPSPGSSLTYAELEAWANRLAGRLVAAGVGPEVRVGLWFERSLEMVVAILATLKAGGAYVPLDPAYPPDRVSFVVEDSGLAVIITSPALAERAPASGRPLIVMDDAARPGPDEHVSPPSVSLHPDNAAYVIYTSGSTGRPKGVVVTHANVIRLMDATDRWFGFGRRDVWTLFHSFAFDFSVWEIWGALLYGGKLIVVPYEVTRAPDEFYDLLCRRRVTILNQTPSAFGQLIESDRRLGREGELKLRAVIFGGEALDLNMLEPWIDRHGDEHPQLVNMYGITETTVHVTYRRIRLADVARRLGSVIGMPISDLTLHLLDEAMQPVPPGALGEVAVGGAGVARCYLHRPALTAQRMVPDPFEPGGRLYLTGDVARRLPDGGLEFRGRADEQVKLRGFRIEPGEIEAALLTHPVVYRAVVLVSQDQSGEKRLVAYVVTDGARADADALTTALRAHAATRLPDYMVPSAIMLLDTLPLTPNGKLDRKALPAPSAAKLSTRRLQPPRTAAEQRLCALFAEVLELDQVGIDENFFALGGHSLLATRLISRIRATLGAELPVRALFEAPTVAGVAARLGDVAAAAPASTIEDVKTDARVADAAKSPELLVPGARRDGPVPLLLAQTRLWFLDLLEPGNPTYNVVLGLRLEAVAERPSERAGLDEAALQRALDEIVRRHEILRTVFRSGADGPEQVVGPPRAFDLQVVDLTAISSGQQSERFAAEARKAARHRFDLSVGPLARGWLFRWSDREHRLLIVMHHIVTDGWSFGVLTRELRELYAAFQAGRPSPLDEPLLQYADYACWQRDRLAGGGLAQQRDYWLRQLADLEPAEILPLDHARKPEPVGRGETLRFRLEPALARGMMETATRHDATLFMTLLTVLAAVLHRSSGAVDLPIGAPVAGRDRVEVEQLIGFFVNTLVLRIDTGGNPTVAQLLARVREVALGAFSHQDLPFEDIVERLAPPRHRGRHPLFGVMLVLQNLPGAPLSLPGLAIAPEEIATGVSKFDLTLQVAPSGDGLDCVIDYNTDLLERSTVELLASRFVHGCAALIQNQQARLAELQLESEAELSRRRAQERGLPLAAPIVSVLDQIFSLAAKQPDAAALSWDDGVLSYRELAQRVRRTGVGLRAEGVAVGSRVGAAFERSPDMIIALLGIMQAGAAYVPLDPGYPVERLAFTIEDSGVCLILAASSDSLHDVMARMNSGPPVRALADLMPDDSSAPDLPSCDCPAYIIYTSGSTGTPKGVMVSQSNLAASTAARAAVYDEPQPRFALLSSFAFDSSVAGIFGSLYAGGTLVLPPPGAERDPIRLLSVLQRERVTQTLMLPALYLALLDAAEGDELATLRTVIVAGEDCPPRLVERHRQALPDAQLANEYGPSEATVWCTVKIWPAARMAMDDAAEVSIGVPIPGVRVWIADAAGHAAPLGAAGELCIGGAGVALGYAGRPARTAESFVPDPQPDIAGARCYRSGDRARFTASGEISLLGRIDRQIKVRGFRVEPGEVEARILQSDWVREVAVTTTRDARDRLQLVAHVVARPGQDGAESGLRRWLAERVPAHLVPATFVWHDQLPRAAGGKVDLAALEVSSRLPRRDDLAAPRNHLELQLVRAWEDVLGTDPIGIDDDFFELGGHSLLAIELIAEIRRRLGRDVPLAALFSSGTVARLAELMSSATQDTGVGTAASGQQRAAVLVPLSSAGAGRPLFLVHQAGGNVMSYLPLARHFGTTGLSLFGLQAVGLDGRAQPLTRIEDMAAHYVDAIRAMQPRGPYRLAGHSLGGRVAQEMARQFSEAGLEVDFLGVIDVPGIEADLSWTMILDEEEHEVLAQLVRQIELFHGRALEISSDALRELTAEARTDLVVNRMKERRLLPANADAAEVSGLLNVYKANMRAIAAFSPRPCRADIHVFATQALGAAHPQDPMLGWSTLTEGRTHVVPVPGEHMSLLGADHAGVLARLILQSCSVGPTTRAPAQDEA